MKSFRLPPDPYIVLLRVKLRNKKLVQEIRSLHGSAIAKLAGVPSIDEARIAAVREEWADAVQALGSTTFDTWRDAWRWFNESEIRQSFVSECEREMIRFYHLPIG